MWRSKTKLFYSALFLFFLAREKSLGKDRHKTSHKLEERRLKEFMGTCNLCRCSILLTNEAEDQRAISLFSKPEGHRSVSP